MMNLNTVMRTLWRQCQGYWAERILSELEYASKVSKVHSNIYDSLLLNTACHLLDAYRGDREISRTVALEAEAMLAEIVNDAKSYHVLCVGHSHMDMNWEWNFSETVSITLSTMRTMLDLMNDYPEFKYSQPQASIYRILEEYDPEMLDEIKHRVQEGRWELNVGSWCEHDLNVPTEESQLRHIQYKQRYIEELFGFSPKETCISFQPDSYGLSENMPEILSKGGIKYLYHARGLEEKIIYKWKAPSGQSILTYREPFWFELYIDPKMVFHVPEFCQKFGLDTAMKVYGVCDHGGGPTRKDIEKILDMQTWPIFPSISIGTFYEYFEYLSAHQEKFPEICGELNFTMPGTFTTQSRLKMANRTSENKLYDAELIAGLCHHHLGTRYSSKQLREAWVKTLFNQFHDILGGTGKIDNREYAMGEFQKILTIANQEISLSYADICKQIDTTGLISIEKEDVWSTSEGAGGGFGIDQGGIPHTERGRGIERIFHAFNPSLTERYDTCVLDIWDWEGDPDKIIILDPIGNIIPHQVLTFNHQMAYNGMQKQKYINYWHHQYIQVLVVVTVPALGYCTLLLKESTDAANTIRSQDGWQTEFETTFSDNYVLENKNIRAVFDKHTLAVLSLKDKRNGKNIIETESGACIFRYLEEEDWNYMSAWTMAPYLKCENIHELGRISNVTFNFSGYRKWIKYSLEYREIKMEVCITLDSDSDRLDYHVKCIWLEHAQVGKYIPMLQFYVPLNYTCKSCLCPVPLGLSRRKAMDMDISANGWIYGENPNIESGCMLLAANKYGFRCHQNALSVTLLRSPYDPDEYPDIGIHEFRISIGVIPYQSDKQLIDVGFCFEHPFRFLSNSVHTGKLPNLGSFLKCESKDVVVSSIKKAEDSESLIIKLYNTSECKSLIRIKFAASIKKAQEIDVFEKAMHTENDIAVEGDSLLVPVNGKCLKIICIDLNFDLNL